MMALQAFDPNPARAYVIGAFLLAAGIALLVNPVILPACRAIRRWFQSFFLLQ